MPVVGHPGGRADQAAREHLPPREHRPRQRAGHVRRRPRHRHLGGDRRGLDQALRLHALHARARAWAATACPSTPATCRGRCGAAWAGPSASSSWPTTSTPHMPDYVVRRLVHALNRMGKPVRGSRVLAAGPGLQAQHRRRPRPRPGMAIAETWPSWAPTCGWPTPTCAPTNVPVRARRADRRRSWPRADAVVLVTDHDAFDYEPRARATPVRARHPQPHRRTQRRAALTAWRPPRVSGSPGRLTDSVAGRGHVVVTGGAGFIGANLCRALAPRRVDTASWSCSTTSPRAGPTTSPGWTGWSWSRARSSTPALLDRVTAGADAVVHLAARASVPRSLEDPWPRHEANATGTLRVLEAARRAGGPHVIVASSSSVYGANRPCPRARTWRRDRCQPLRGQQAGRRGVRAGLRPLVRPPGARVPLLQRLRAAAARRSRLRRGGARLRLRRPRPASRCPSTATGLQTRDFTFVGSVVGRPGRGSGARRDAPGPVNLAFGGRASLLELIAELSSRARAGPPAGARPGPGRRRPRLAGRSDAACAPCSPPSSRCRSPTGCGPRRSGSAPEHDARLVTEPSGRIAGAYASHLHGAHRHRQRGAARVSARSAPWADVLGLAWVVLAGVAVLVPALAHGASLGPFDQLTRYGLSQPDRHGGALHRPRRPDRDAHPVDDAWPGPRCTPGTCRCGTPTAPSGMPLVFNWQSAAFSVPALIGYLFPLHLAYTVGQVVVLVVGGHRRLRPRAGAAPGSAGGHHGGRGVTS